MTDKVYLATSREYATDGDKIEGIFTDEAFCDTFVERHVTPANGMQKEVRELNPGVKYLAEGLTGFRVQINYDGSIHSHQKYALAHEGLLTVVVHHGLLAWVGINPLESRWLDIYCWALDEQCARKMAREAHVDVTVAKAWGTEGLFEREAEYNAEDEEKCATATK